MQELKQKFNISESFFNRYFKENAQNRFGIELSKFLWYKIGKFLNPQKHEFYLNEFIKDEIINFYEKKELYIPFLEINVTTKCTLRCKDCCALIPEFNNHTHINLSFEDFKRQLDKICDAASVRHLILLGGEPLINPHLPEMVEYASQKNNISIIRITTNGTMLPSVKLLETIKNTMENGGVKIYFYISNYSANTQLNNILKYDEIKQILQEYNIKFQMVDSWSWLAERGLSDIQSDEAQTVKRASECFRIKCTQILNGKLGICSKALAAREFGILKQDDFIDLAKTSDLKSDLIKFFQTEAPYPCSFCRITDETVKPAIQLD